MPSLCSSELIHLQETTGPVYNDKKVNFLTIGEDFLSKVSADLVHGQKVPQRYIQARGPCLALGGFNLQAPSTRLYMILNVFFN